MPWLQVPLTTLLTMLLPVYLHYFLLVYLLALLLKIHVINCSIKLSFLQATVGLQRVIVWCGLRQTSSHCITIKALIFFGTRNHSMSLTHTYTPLIQVSSRFIFDDFLLLVAQLFLYFKVQWRMSDFYCLVFIKALVLLSE